MIMSQEEKEDFQKQLRFFTAYFNGDPLPPKEINIEELEAKWKRTERVQKVKEKLALRRRKREKKREDEEKILSGIYNLRLVDCCLVCNNNTSCSDHYVECNIFQKTDVAVNNLCNKFKV